MSRSNERPPKMNFTKDEDFCHDVRKYFREYCDVTGIHGLRYIAEKRSMVEKIVWIILFLVSLGGCCYMIYEIVYKYKTSPVVVNFATNDRPIHEIPFPAVTICPESKCARTKFNYSDVYFKLMDNKGNIPENELKSFAHMSLLCDKLGVDEFTFPKDDTLDETFFSNIDKLKPEPLLFCDYMSGYYKPCENILTPIITDEGICYSFNILDRKDIFRDQVTHYSDFHVSNESSDFDGETGFVQKNKQITYPRRAYLAGADNPFSVMLIDTAEDTDHACTQFLQGFRVAVHNPMNIPKVSKNFFRIPHDKVVLAAVEPHVITISDTVKGFSPEKRNCYLPEERYLKYFKKYTEPNCMLECVTNATLELCDCVDFSMPRHNETAICGAGKRECVEEAKNAVYTGQVLSKISETPIIICDCKPLCQNLRYSVQTSHSDFAWMHFTRSILERVGVNFAQEQNEIHISKVDIFFKLDEFIPLERNELYGVSDLISNFGGLIGLFTGFSLLSIAEILYFLSLRIYYNVKLYGLWSGK